MVNLSSIVIVFLKNQGNFIIFINFYISFVKTKNLRVTVMDFETIKKHIFLYVFIKLFKLHELIIIHTDMSVTVMSEY